MIDQVKKAESELNSARKLWWFLLLATGVYALLAYLFSGTLGAEDGGNGTVDVQWQILVTFVFTGSALLSFIISMRFPSSNRLREILLRKGEKQPATLSTSRARGSAPQPSVFGTLMLGAVMAEGVSVWGLLLAFLGVRDNSQMMIVFGYILILLGALALVFHRWHSARLVMVVLREIGTRRDTRETRRNGAA